MASAVGCATVDTTRCRTQSTPQMMIVTSCLQVLLKYASLHRPSSRRFRQEPRVLDFRSRRTDPSHLSNFSGWFSPVVLSSEFVCFAVFSVGTGTNNLYTVQLRLYAKVSAKCYDLLLCTLRVAALLRPLFEIVRPVPDWLIFLALSNLYIRLWLAIASLNLRKLGRR